METGLLELESSPADHEALNRLFRTLAYHQGVRGDVRVRRGGRPLPTRWRPCFSLAREGRVGITPDILTLALGCRDILHAMLFDPGKALGDVARREEAVAALRRAAGVAVSGPASATSPSGVAAPGGQDGFQTPSSQAAPESRVYRIRFMPGLGPPGARGPGAGGGGPWASAGPSSPPRPRMPRPTPVPPGTWCSPPQPGSTPSRGIFLLAGDESLVDVQALDADSEAGGPRLGADPGVARGTCPPSSWPRPWRASRASARSWPRSSTCRPRPWPRPLAEQEGPAQGGRAAQERPEPGQPSGCPRTGWTSWWTWWASWSSSRPGWAAWPRAGWPGDRQLAAAAESLDQQFQALSGPGKPPGRPAAWRRAWGGFWNSPARGAAQDRVLSGVSEELGRLTDDLRYYILEMRMLPFGSISGKFRRLVRDLSAELGKKVELAVLGEDTELDKTVIDKLSDPLVHILRNSIDHGLESPEERERAGKNPQGRIVVQAEHSGGDVLVRVSDDGRGLDEARIRAKAVEAGILEENAVVSREDVLGLIFRPGFSTARTVTGVSGRGVGMDVVKKSIESLQGALGLDSQPGRGTALTIKIPLTLAIIERAPGALRRGELHRAAPDRERMRGLQGQRRGGPGLAPDFQPPGGGHPLRVPAHLFPPGRRSAGHGQDRGGRRQGPPGGAFWWTRWWASARR